jgi:Protein required for attachment to host cells
MMNTVWVLVCDAARGKLFEIREKDPLWHVIETFSHPESRSKAAGLVTDHMGHNSSEGGSAHHNPPDRQARTLTEPFHEGIRYFFKPEIREESPTS